MKSIFSQKSSAPGVDLGNRWAKLVQLQPKRKKTELASLGRFLWKQEENQNRAMAASKMNDIWNNLGISEKKVVSALAGHGVIIKHFSLSAQNQDMDSAIKQHARDYNFPFDLNEVYLDYQFLDTDSDGQSIKTVLVASKMSVVDDIREFFQTASLSLNIVDIEGFALCNCFEFNYPERASEPAYILDIGSTSSIFAVYAQGYPQFIRDMSIGGEQITRIIAQGLDVDLTSAERIKLSGTDQTDTQNWSKVTREIRDTFASWTDDVQRLITLYQNAQEHGTKEEVSKLYLAGGGSLLPGIKEAFAKELNLEVEHINPLRNISYSERYFDPAYLDSSGPQFAVATGLALRGVEG